MPASHDRTQNSWDHDLSPPVSGQVSDSGGRRSAPSTSLSSGVDGPENHGSYPSSRLPIFIDKVANALDLSPRYRGELHAFKELALELSPGLQRAIIYQQGSIYKTLQNAEDLRADITTMKQELKDIGEQLSKRFVVSEDQHDDILALAKAMVIEPGRDDFNFADEQVQRLKDAAQFPRFKDIFKSKANTKTVTQVVRRQASYARNAYRQFLRNSVFDGRKKCGLTACARQASRKFNNGEDVTPEMVLQIAILRRFIRDNRELVASDAVSDPWDSDDETQDGDGDGTGTRKRKRARSAVHFWGAVTDFFKAKNDIWGKGLRTNGWATFIDECLEQERELFPDDNLRDIPQRAGATMSNNAPSNGAGYRLPDWASDGMASTSTESAPFASTASGSLSTEEMSRTHGVRVQVPRRLVLVLLRKIGLARALSAPKRSET
ncbi:hypothetical protein BV20DRAFT_18360 [Pilatotrama ljubarskyi]|nr:hypothetical protein BV20DRAFT_18360 [Pilatotrama ljubarskyi]